MSAARILTLTLAQDGRRMPPGLRTSYEFRQCGGSIGRADECDWVLAAPGISRTHAVVRYVHGLYFLEDRSTNGMLRNGAPLARGEPVTLDDGDRLQMDTFEVAVALRDAAPVVVPPAAHAGGFDDDRTLAVPAHPPATMPAAAPPMRGYHAAAPLPPVASAAGYADPVEDLLAGIGGTGELDPLRLFDAPAQAIAPPPADPGWNHSAASADHFRAPRAAASAPVLPEEWDLTRGDFAMSGPARPPAPAPAAPMPPAPMPPASMPPAPMPPASMQPAPAPAVALPPEPFMPDLDELFGMPPAAPAHAAVPPVAAPPPVATPAPAPIAAPAAPGAPPPAWPVAAAPPAPAPGPAQVHAAAPAPAAAAPAASQELSPELDSILRIVIDGVMEVLRARAEIKNTFRLPVTIIQRSENNPLKFAATPAEAMQRLMQADGAFLSGSAAFEDAFNDIRFHQVAMLAGMRAAFESLLAHFNPDRLEREVDGTGGRRAFSGKGRYWEHYREDFERAARDPDECFRMLFGDEFAKAYEAQLARLKSARRREQR